MLGDAAHLVSPFTNEGANLALLDGVKFTEALLAHPNDVQTALAFYEAAFPRSEATADESNHNLSISFQLDAPRGMLNLMAQYAHKEE